MAITSTIFLKSDLSASELAAAQAFLSGKGGQLSTVEYRSSRAETRSSVRTSQSETPQNPATAPESQNEDLASLLQELYALPLSQRHVESDGLVFDPAQITKRYSKWCGSSSRGSFPFHSLFANVCFGRKIGSKSTNWRSASSKSF